MGVLFNHPQWSNRYHRVAEEVNAAVDVAWQPQKRGAAIRVLVTFDTAPTTAGDVEVIFDSADGDNYDTVVENDDPSASGGVTDLVFLSENAIPLLEGDAVRVKYTNADTRRVNVTIIGSDDFA